MKGLEEIVGRRILLTAGLGSVLAGCTGSCGNDSSPIDTGRHSTWEALP